jgi:hypothetical protein
MSGSGGWGNDPTFSGRNSCMPIQAAVRAVSARPRVCPPGDGDWTGEAEARIPQGKWGRRPARGRAGVEWQLFRQLIQAHSGTIQGSRHGLVHTRPLAGSPRRARTAKGASSIRERRGARRHHRRRSGGAAMPSGEECTELRLSVPCFSTFGSSEA